MFSLCRLEFMHHPRCAHPCVAFAKLLSLKGKILQASLLVISCNVFLFSFPFSHSAPLLCFPCWNGLSSLAPVDTSFVAACNLFLLLDAHVPSSSLASQHLAKLPSQFCGLYICAAHGNGNWAELNEMMPWWIFSLMNASASIGSQASTVNVQKRNCPPILCRLSKGAKIYISSVCYPLSKST